MRRCFTALIVLTAVLFLTSCGKSEYTGTSGNFGLSQARYEAVEPEDSLTDEERFMAENTDEYLMWFNGKAVDLREIDPADYYTEDEIMRRWRELYPFDPEDLFFETPDSSCFSRIGYDWSREMLALEFRSSGKIYVCYDFTADDWTVFTGAESLGKYYNAHIKDNYYCEKWD